MSPIFHLFTFLSFFLLILDFLRLFDLPMNLQLSFRWKYLRFETTRVFDFSYMSIFEWYTKCDAGEEIILFLKGIVRSKISRGYIKVQFFVRFWSGKKQFFFHPRLSTSAYPQEQEIFDRTSPLPYQYWAFYAEKIGLA